MGPIERRLKEIEQRTQEREVAKVAYDVWVEYTPRASGNAVRNTKLVNNEIRADYPYALRLDQGYSRQKGGVGMSKPALDAVQKYIEKKV